jgi:hypothetical protein
MGLLRKPANCQEQEYHKVAALRSVGGPHKGFYFFFFYYGDLSLQSLSCRS